MKTKWMFSLLVIAAVFLVGSSRAAAKPQSVAAGTAFTYQGRLIDGGLPANGAYDFSFTLFDADVGGTPVAGVVEPEDVPVADGLFTVQLDFGAVYDGSVRFLEIGVRPGASTGTYTLLGPRQRLNPTPYALDAFTAPWTGLTGIPAGFADGIDDISTYTNGNGLQLIGNQFSVLFGGSGTANTAARSDHNHWGQSWGGTGTGLSLSGGSIGLYSQGATAGVFGYSPVSGGKGVYGMNTAASGDYAGYFDGNVQVNGHQSITGTGVTVTIGGGDLGVTAIGNNIGLQGTGGSTGVFGTTSGIDGSGVYGSAASGNGVRGFGKVGVSGETSVGGWAGVLGRGSAAGIPGIRGDAYQGSGNYAGVFNGNVQVNGNQTVSGSGTTLTVLGGTTGVDASGTNFGLMGSASGSMGVKGTGLYGVYGVGSYVGVNGVTSVPGATGVYGAAYGGVGNYAGYFQGNVYINGDYTATGTKSAAVRTQTYGTRALYAMESPENWFEDFGSGQLVNGKAVISIDPVFAQTVNLNDDYHIFLTPYGPCALYVTAKTPTSFSVGAFGQPGCSTEFDYRIVAKRLGYEDLRLAVSDQAAAGQDAAGTDRK